MAGLLNKDRLVVDMLGPDCKVAEATLSLW